MPAKADGKNPPVQQRGKDPEKGKDMWETMKPKLVNSNFQTAVYFIVMVLFLAALIFIILYLRKHKYVTENITAAGRIITFTRTYNASSKKKKPIKVFKASGIVIEHLHHWFSRNDDVRRSVDEVLNLFKANWVSFGGYMYHYTDRGVRYEVAKNTCLEKNLTLPEIYSDEEQTFFEQQSLVWNYGTWLGMERNKDDKYEWLSGRRLVVKYWKNKEYAEKPNLEQAVSCVYYFVCYPKDKKKCWNPEDCGIPFRFYCRMKPNPQWLLKKQLK